MKAARTTNHKAMRALSEQIARDFNPQKIILFGSYAHGNPTWDSDVDLLVVMPFPGATEQTSSQDQKPNRYAVSSRLAGPDSAAGIAATRDGRLVYARYH